MLEINQIFGSCSKHITTNWHSFVSFIFLLCRSCWTRWLLLNNIEHLPLNVLLLEDEAIFIPDEVWILRVVPVPLHAPFE